MRAELCASPALNRPPPVSLSAELGRGSIALPGPGRKAGGSAAPLSCVLARVTTSGAEIGDGVQIHRGREAHARSVTLSEPPMPHARAHALLARLVTRHST